MLKGRVLPALFALVAAAISAGLGFWQVDRREQRRAWIAEGEARLALPPAPVAEVLADPKTNAFRRVIAEGRYDLAGSILLDHRRREGRSGTQLITPLRMPGRERALLVDRGFLPRGAESPFLEQAGDEPARVVGALVPIQRRERRPGKLEPRKVFVRLVPGALEDQLGYPVESMLLVRADEGADTPPLGRDVRPRSPVDHTHYVVFWFSVSAIALLMAILIAWRGIRGATSPGTARAGART